MTAYLDAGDDPDALAETCIRRLANRHGCTRRKCPDRRAHERDVASMSVVLEAVGFLPYEPGRPPKPPRGAMKTIVNYRRPGGSR